MIIRKDHIEAAAKTAPPGYVDVYLANRVRHLDTSDTIFVPRDRRALIRAWVADPSLPKPVPTAPVRLVPPTPHSDSWADRGPKLWAKFHAMLGAFDGDLPALLKKLAAFRREIGCGTCGVHFDEMMERTPPTFTTQEEAVQWGIDRHNEVNVRLGKPVWLTPLN